MNAGKNDAKQIEPYDSEYAEYSMDDVSQGPIHGDGGREGELWAAFTAVNRYFTDVIIQCFNEGDLIWIHGFHLMILPSFLTRRVSMAKIGIFFHTPFPSSEIFRTLWCREDLLRGLLNADQVGFHLFEYARHFLTCCRRLLGLNYGMFPDSSGGHNLAIDTNGRHVSVTSIHAGVEPPELGHFRSKEAATSTRIGYMDTIQRPNSVNSSLINARMRGILIDWLIEVHLKFKLAPDTLYLTVNIIDRYLDTTLVTRPRLQLVGVTAFMIATKYEEVYPPELRDLVYICDGSYTRLEILDMEERILTKLKYNVTVPTAHAFLVRYLKAAHASHGVVHLSRYILDGTLTCYKLLKYLPSQLAAAAVLIARKNSPDFRNWSPTLQAYTKYTEEELVPVARAILAEKAATPQSWKSVKTKYTSTKFGEVALLNIPSDF